MEISVGNHMAEITKSANEEDDWLEDYLSVSEPLFKQDYRTGRMVPNGTVWHTFVKRNKFPAGFIRLVTKGAKREGYRIKITDVRVPASAEPVDLNYTVVNTYAEERELMASDNVPDLWLRYHQADALKAIIKKRRGVIWHPTGAGKTELAIAATQTIPIQWLFVVQDKVLLHNAARRYEKRTGKKAKIIGDGIVDLTGDGNFTVAMAQTLDRNRDNHELWDVVRNAEGLIIDECFPPGTLVGGKPIQHLKAGDVVPAYDERSGKFVHRKVVQLFETRADTLVRLHMSDGRTIVCTPGHPFLTRAGWRPAAFLKGSLVLCSKHHAEETTNDQPDQVPDMHSDVHSHVPSLVRPQEGETEVRLLQEGMCEERSKPASVPEKHTQPRGILTSDEEKQSDAHARCKSQDDAVTEDQRNTLGTSGTRRQRARTDSTRAAHDHSVGQTLGDAACSTNQEVERIRLPNQLQDRHRQPSADDCDRDRRHVTQHAITSGARHQENEPSIWTRVDRVEVLEQGSDGQFESLCPEGLVYNIEVEDTHTYIVNGAVVHNCHQTPAKTIFQITVASINAAYRIGLSGTPFDRGDQKGMATIGALGPVIHRVKSDELIAAGFLSEPDITMYECEQESSKPTFQGAYGDLIVKSTKRNKLAVDIMTKCARPFLAFVKQVNHGKDLIKRGEKKGLRLAFVWGDKNTKQRDAAIRDLERGDIDGIVCNVVFQQGIDIPSLAGVCRFMGGKSVISTLQVIGRGMRVTETKNTFEVHDIFDVGNNWMEKHSTKRRKSYEREGHKVKYAYPEGYALH